jgi:predicted RNA-binding Zn-ribbon protein involved in translation (DUF1610 family)
MTIISRRTIPFIAIIFFAFLVFLFSLWDILYHEQWLERIIALYGILILLTILFLISREKKKPIVQKPVENFEQSLEGKLQHFKCPSCGGIFAIKKSKQNNKQPFTLTCPDCGMTGFIPSKPSQIQEEIPEKKSVHKNFQCQNCGEWIMIWSEGTDIIGDQNIHVYSCPYCGATQDLCLT